MVAGIIPNDIDLTIFQGDETTSLAIFAGASSQGCDILFAWPKPGPVSVLFNRSKKRGIDADFRSISGANSKIEVACCSGTF